MYCCGSCIGSKHLSEHIKVHSENIGICNLCGSKQENLILPSQLSDEFSKVLDLYCLAVDKKVGRHLIDLLRDDWGLFKNSRNLDAERLLKLILDDDDFSCLGFKSRLKREESFTDSWGRFKLELKHENRFFPKSFPDHNELSSLLSFISLQTGRDIKELYRARISEDHTLFEFDKMGAPPSDIAAAGRANPFGISYLYVASNEETAISELRPHKGDFISVAKFSLHGGLKLIDLRDPITTISPFRYSDEDLEMVHSKLGLLIKLGEELTMPIAKGNAPLEYLSTQYICEFIKSKGFDGVIYKSALGGGDNYAIFNSSRIQIENVHGYNIVDINIGFNPSGHILEAEQSNNLNSEIYEGVVDWFNDDKGFGFIKSDAFKAGIFVHYSSIVTGDVRATLGNEELVSFRITEGEKGLSAVDVVSKTEEG